MSRFFCFVVRGRCCVSCRE